MRTSAMNTNNNDGLNITKVFNTGEVLKMRACDKYKIPVIPKSNTHQVNLIPATQILSAAKTEAANVIKCCSALDGQGHHPFSKTSCLAKGAPGDP